MLVDLIMQYWIGTSKDEENDKKPFILILAIELLLAIVGLLVGYQIGFYIVIVGYICGFLLPLFGLFPGFVIDVIIVFEIPKFKPR